MAPSSANPFDVDVSRHGGYRYTTDAPLSSEIANRRLTEETLRRLHLRGRTVLDVGCGDGTYTVQLLQHGGARSILGTDVAAEAIAEAAARYADMPELTFEALTVAEVAARGDRFDVAVVRGVLHHADDPAQLVADVASVVDEVLIIEPNGYNGVLKVIEKASPYHRAHGERSFPARRIRGWLGAAGLRPSSDGFVGLVPFFCPAPAARLLKRIEPAIERSGLAAAACACYVVHATR